MSDKDYKEGIIDRLTQLEEVFNLRATAFGESIGIAQSQYSKIKRGVIGTTIPQVKAINDFYKVRSGWLLDGEGEIFVNEESGPSTVPDRSLLTQMKKQTEELLANFSKLLEDREHGITKTSQADASEQLTLKPLGKKKTGKPQGTSR